MLLQILLATILIGLASLVGAFSFVLNKHTLNKALLVLVSFSAGTLLAGSLLHLLPEALELLNSNLTFAYTVLGFIAFFLIEKLLHWHHCKGGCEAKPLTYMILFGDGIHNFIDGLVIAASFLVSIPFGVITTLLIMAHEIPQELGDFGVLVYGGFDRVKALVYNFLSQLTCVVGGLIGYFFGSGFNAYLLPVAAGGFIYIAASDLVPEMHKEVDLKKSLVCIAFFLIGIFFVTVIKLFH